MTERFRERLGYLSDEFDERTVQSQLRSVSPNNQKSGSRSPRRSSKSPRPNRGDETNVQTIIMKDSRPEIIAWPTPPNITNMDNNTNIICSDILTRSYDNANDEPIKLLTILKAASTGVPRGRESELKKKIQTLEDTVAEYERQKYNVMGTFSEYRERVAERERKLEAEYSSKIIALSEEVLGAKKDFEARMKNFQALQEKFEREKEQALEKLRQEHQKEIQLLEQRFSESQLLNLEQKYMIEIQRLEEERKSLKSEKERLGETFEMKLRRAQSLYETELAASKMLYSRELEALRDHEEALKEELIARQDEFHDRLQELQHQSKRSREELVTCKNEVTALERRLQAKEAEVLAISRELEEARNETNDSLRKLSKVESELQQAKLQYRQQEEELQRKSNLLNIVETAKTKLEAVISDLQTEVKALKNKVEFLEKERENLQSQSESQTKLQNSQVNALEAVLESVTKEKENTKQNYEGLLNKERQQAKEREFAMKKEFSSKLNELEDQYHSLKEHLEQDPHVNQSEIHEEKDLELSSSVHLENTVLIAELNALKATLADITKNQPIQKDESLEKVKIFMEETEKLREELKKQRNKLNEKEMIIEKMMEQMQRENELNDDQLLVIRREIREELLQTEEFLMKEKEIERLNKKIMEIENDNIDKLCSCNTQKGSSRFGYHRKDDEISGRYKKVEKDIEKSQGNDKEKDEDSKKAFKEEKFDEKLNDEARKLESIHEEEIRQIAVKAKEMNKNLEAKIELLTKDSSEKSGLIETLHVQISELMDELRTIQTELERKNIEIKCLGERNEKYLRHKEDQQAEIFEHKIINLNKEHETTIELMKERERELIKTLQEVQEKQKEIPENESLDLSQANVIRSDVFANEYTNDELSELKKELDEKDDLIISLNDEFFSQCCNDEDMEAKNSPTGSNIHREIANKFQIFSSQIMKKRTKCIIDGTKGENSYIETKVEKDEKSEKIETDRIGQLGSGAFRSKSPSLLPRLRERSPLKSSTSSLDCKHKDDKKNLLSPMDAERMMDERRKGSPSRQLLTRPKKDTISAGSGIPLSTIPKEDSGKRPAWKF